MRGSPRELNNRPSTTWPRHIPSPGRKVTPEEIELAQTMSVLDPTLSIGEFIVSKAKKACCRSDKKETASTDSSKKVSAIT